MTAGVLLMPPIRSAPAHCLPDTLLLSAIWDLVTPQRFPTRVLLAPEHHAGRWSRGLALARASRGTDLGALTYLIAVVAFSHPYNRYGGSSMKRLQKARSSALLLQLAYELSSSRQKAVEGIYNPLTVGSTDGVPEEELSM